MIHQLQMKPGLVTVRGGRVTAETVRVMATRRKGVRNYQVVAKMRFETKPVLKLEPTMGVNVVLKEREAKKMVVN